MVCVDCRLGTLPDQTYARKIERVKSHKKGPGGAGASIYSIVLDELPSAARRHDDRFALREQFLAQVPFAV